MVVPEDYTAGCLTSPVGTREHFPARAPGQTPGACRSPNPKWENPKPKPNKKMGKGNEREKGNEEREDSPTQTPRPQTSIPVSLRQGRGGVPWSSGRRRNLGREKNDPGSNKKKKLGI